MTTKDINFWLNESELKTPIHDEMVLWCFNNYEKILDSFKLKESKIQYSFYGNEINYNNELKYGNWDWESEKFLKRINLEGYEKEAGENFKKGVEKDYIEFKKLLKDVNRNNERIEVSKIIEFPIPSSSGWNIGFVDLKISIKLNLIKINYFQEVLKNLEGWEEMWENNNYKKIKHFFFEIKPEIKSIGEVMRQINYYRKYLSGDFIIITKTKGLKEIFESQGIYIYEYEGGQQTL